MALPGVKVGPLDPDATSEFGQVAAKNSARTLIRLHRQLYPADLLRHLARAIDPERTKGLDLDEVTDYLGGLEHDNGDPLVPDGAMLVGATVRGERRDPRGQVLCWQAQLSSGRIKKGYAPYNADVLPDSFDAGAELVKVKEMTDRGVVSFDSEGTRTQILERQLREKTREARALRAYVDGHGDEPDEESGDASAADIDLRDGNNLAEDNQRLCRENAEMRERLAKLEALVGSVGGGVPTGGLEQDIPHDSVASADEPVDGYDDLNADVAARLLRSDDIDVDTRERILAYEQTHKNRKSVVAAGREAGAGGSDG